MGRDLDLASLGCTVAYIRCVGTYALEGPRDVLQAADGLSCQLRERGGREVEVIGVATDAAVDDRDDHGLAIIYNVMLATALDPPKSALHLHLAVSFWPQMGLLLGLAPLYPLAQPISMALFDFSNACYSRVVVEHAVADSNDEIALRAL